MGVLRVRDLEMEETSFGEETGNTDRGRSEYENHQHRLKAHGFRALPFKMICASSSPSPLTFLSFRDLLRLQVEPVYLDPSCSLSASSCLTLHHSVIKRSDFFIGTETEGSCLIDLVGPAMAVELPGMVVETDMEADLRCKLEIEDGFHGLTVRTFDC